MIFLCRTAYPLWQEDKVDLWPIFTYDDNPTKINFLWPITMYKHAPDETSFALRPLFHSASEGNEYNLDLIWPLGKYSSEGEDIRKVYFWPISYYSKDNDEKKIYLFPIYYHRDGNKKSYSIIPLFHYSDENFYLFPFYMRMDEYSKRIFSPLFYYGREPNKKEFWFINTYYRNNLNAKERTEVFFPVYFRGYDKNSRWLFVFPIGGKHQGETRSKTMALFPLYLNFKNFKDSDKREVKNSETHFLWPLGKYNKSDGKKKAYFWPIAYYSSDGDHEKKFYLFPIYYHRDGDEKNYCIIPVFYYGNKPKGKAFWFINTYYRNDLAAKEKDLWIVPIYFKGHGRNFRYLFVFPIGGKYEGKSKSTTMALFPLYLNTKCFNDNNKKEVKNSETHFLWPLGKYSKNYSQKCKMSSIRIFPIFKKEIKGQKKSGYLMWPLYWFLSDNLEKSEGLICYKKHKQETYYRDFYERDYKSDHTGIVLWRWDEKGKVITKTYPDNKKDTKPSDTKEIAYKRSGLALWPLYYHKNFNGKAGHYFIWPLLGRPKQYVSRNNKLSKWDWDFIFPIGEYTKENEKVSILDDDYEIKPSLEYDAKNNLKTIGLWPLYKYQKETSKINKERFGSRHSFLWPLGKIIVNKDKEGKKFTGQRFFPLYWSKREEDNNKTVQKTKLWPILGYGMDDKGKYSLSLVSPFPALEDPEGYEANWAPYFSFYHIQGVKNEYKESFILYRLYRHYKSSSERQLQIWMLYDYFKQKDKIKVNLLKGFLGYEKDHNKKHMRLLYFKIPVGNKGKGRI